MSPPLLSVENLDVSYDGAVQALRNVSLEVGEGRSSRSSGPTGPARRRCCGPSPAHSASTGARSPAAPSDTRASTSPGWTPPPSSAGAWCRSPRGGGSSATSRSRRTCGPAGSPCGDTKTRNEARDRVFDLFPILAERRAQLGGLLSGGQQQMLAMGRALMTSPKLLLLDEPSLGLAPLLVDQIGEIVTGDQPAGHGRAADRAERGHGPAGSPTGPTFSRSAT